MAFAEEAEAALAVSEAAALEEGEPEGAGRSCSGLRAQGAGHRAQGSGHRAQSFHAFAP